MCVYVSGTYQWGMHKGKASCTLLIRDTLVPLFSGSQLCFPCTKLTLLAKMNLYVSMQNQFEHCSIIVLAVAKFAFPVPLYTVW